MQGILPEERGLWYSGASLFLALVFLFGGNLEAVVIIQILLSCASACFIYLSAKKITQNIGAGILASVLYIVWIPIHEWNTFIYTESLFTSFCILSFTALLFSRNRWHYALTAILFLYTFSIRPTGFSLVVAWAVYLIVLIPRPWLKIIIIPIIVVLGVFIQLIGNTMLQSYNPVPAYIASEIIYPKITLGIEAPANLIVPDAITPLQKVFSFALYNPIYFMKLFFIKVALFYGNIKPYYSLIHNLAIILFLYPLYYFACCSFSGIKGFQKEKFFMASFILANGTIVGLTTENWDGRFLVPVLPFIFVLASGPLFVCMGRMFRKKIKSMQNHLTH
jgi:hypothetical protein